MNSFQYALRQLGREGHFSFEEPNIVYTSQAVREQKAIHVKIADIYGFILDHVEELRAADIPDLQKIEAKLVEEAETPELKDKIHFLSQDILKIINSRSHIPKHVDNSSNLGILFCVALKPSNLFELLRNLKLVTENPHQYSLGNDLTVYDTKHGICPVDTSLEDVRDMLSLKFEEYKNQSDNADVGGNLLALKEFVDQTRKDLKPKKVVQLSLLFMSQTSSDNTANLITIMSNLNSGLPVVTTKAMVRQYPQKFQEFLLSCDLYSQVLGSLVFLIPKGTKPSDFALSEEEIFTDEDKKERRRLELDYIERCVDIEQTLKNDAFNCYTENFSKDLELLLLNDQEDIGYYRLLCLEGHGDYSKDIYKNSSGSSKGVIAGLDLMQIQDILRVCYAKNTVFLSLSSCYAGGENLNHIHLPDGSLPFYVIVNSSSEICSYAELNFSIKPIFDKAEELIFPSLSLEYLKEKLVPRPLTQAQMSDITKASTFSDENFITNLGTALMSNTDPSIPRLAFTGIYHNKIFDIQRQIKTLYQNLLETTILHKPKPHQEIRDTNPEKITYIFSDPVIPFDMVREHSTPITFFSRGGNAHHVVKSMTLPQSLEQLCFNIFNSNEFDGEEVLDPTFKVFVIGELHCLYEGKQQKLTHVVIENTPFYRRVFFQKEGLGNFESIDYHKRPRTNSKGIDWVPVPTKKILEPHEAMLNLFLAVIKSQPSNGSLLLATGGRVNQREFYEALDFLWKDQIPPSFRLFQAFAYGMAEEKEDENSIETRLHRDYFAKVLKEFCDCQLEFNEKFIHLTNVLSLARGFGKEFHGSLLIQAILKEAGETNREEEPLNDIVNLAFRLGQLKIAKRLLICGGKPFKGENQITSLERALVNRQNSEDLIQILGLYGPLSENEIDTLWLYAIEYEDQNLAQFLIGEKLGFDSPTSPLMVALTNENLEIAKMLLTQEAFDINNSQNRDVLVLSILKGYDELIPFILGRIDDFGLNDASSGFTALHHLIRTKNEPSSLQFLSLMLYRCDINKPDEEGNTPLHDAILKQHYQVVELLISKGASLEVSNHNRITPLNLAVLSLDEKMVKIILNHHPDVKNEDGFRSLQYALQFCSLSLLRLLVKRQAGINRGSPPWDDLFTKKDKRVLELFLNNRNFTSKEIVQGIRQAIAWGDLSLLQLLFSDARLKSGDLDIESKKEEMIINLVLKSGRGDLLRYVLLKRVRTLRSNSVKMALEMKRIDLVMILAHHGVSFSQKEKFQALLLAIQEKNIAAVNWLLSQGVNLSLQDHEGNTPLHHAIHSSEILKVFLKKGVEIETRNKAGQTALQKAFFENKLDSSLLLLRQRRKMQDLSSPITRKFSFFQSNLFQKTSHAQMKSK